jgi:hypothetical protein
MAELQMGAQSGGVQELTISTGSGQPLAEMLSATDAVASVGGSVAITPFGLTMLNVSLLTAALTATASLGNAPGKTSGEKLPVGALKAFGSAQTVATAKALTMAVSYINMGTQSLPVFADNGSLALGSVATDAALMQWNGNTWKMLSLTSSLNTYAT